MKPNLLKLLFPVFLLITLVHIASNSTAQATPARSLLALSKNDHVLCIIDPVTLKEVARVPVGSDPHEVVASADHIWRRKPA